MIILILREKCIYFARRYDGGVKIKAANGCCRCRLLWGAAITKKGRWIPTAEIEKLKFQHFRCTITIKNDECLYTEDAWNPSRTCHLPQMDKAKRFARMTAPMTCTHMDAWVPLELNNVRPTMCVYAVIPAVKPDICVARLTTNYPYSRLMEKKEVKDAKDNSSEIGDGANNWRNPWPPWMLSIVWNCNSA